MKNIYKVLPVFLAVALLLCSCGTNAEEDYNYEDLIEAPVDISVTDCITEQQVSDVMGTTMVLLGTFEDGTQVIYTSEDSLCQVNVNLKNQTRESFDAHIASLGDSVEMVTSVGEVAYWCEETGELLVYHNGYFLGVAVWREDTTEVGSYVSQIAELIWKKLPKE